QIAWDRVNDRVAAGDLCRAGRLRFVTATGEDLAALRNAVQPVYDDLERDPATRAAIAAIEQIKRRSPSPPDILPRCGKQVSRANDVVTPFDGVWRMDTKYGDDPTDQTPMAENYGTYIFVFAHGRFAFNQEYQGACTWGYGTFVVTGHHVAWSFE